ncbi:MAG: RidA family protein [Nannocystaceae bacterium]|nr:RidA family protein [Nannocystaceae bacterium]
MSHSFLNPSELHDPTQFGYSHTASVPAGTGLVFVAGQYGSGSDGMVVSDIFAEQVQRAFRNVGVALAAHGLKLNHVVQLRTYVVNLGFEELGVIAKIIQSIWDANPPTQTLIGVASLAMPEMRFEVEAVAALSPLV